MGLVARRAYRALVRYGWDPRVTMRMALGRRRVAAEHREFARQRRLSAQPEAFPEGDPWPIAVDVFDDAGTASGHYFHQDLYVARKIFEAQPKRHIDVGSRIDGFVAHVATFRDIEVVDVRPLTSRVPGITYLQADLMQVPPAGMVADSVSCLHALEHFGLGRYGDPVSYEGWALGLNHLSRIVAPGGVLYLSVPAGRRQRVEFNAHRVFSLPFFMKAVGASFVVEDLAFVDDQGDLLTEVEPNSPEAQRTFDAEYGCMIWTLRKPLTGAAE